MEGREQQVDNIHLQSFPKLPVWIIEYVWAHKMMDLQEVVDASHWPDVDSQPLSLEDTWRLRVASAQVYSIVKNRNVEHFERVMGFLEATYRLLPALVAPIKHMKIMFGLKTMVIMWMLRMGRGMVETVSKIITFFPSKLPQYQDQCSQHDMFLMRKNNLDFKTLAQALAMDKDKLEGYMKKHMEEQYGEHYAQKVEDRLLHYLHKLEAVLPGDTYIDKILKKSSPVTEEEKLLLEVVTCDSTTIATTLKTLLHCDFASCRQDTISQSSGNRDTETESSQLSVSILLGSSTKAVLRPADGKAALEEVRGRQEVTQEVSRDSPNVSLHQRTEDRNCCKRVEEEQSDKVKEEMKSREPTSSPHFCSKHQRWVKSILQECPDECSEELLLQANISLSPLLFQSSSSTFSSQDLTPSDLIPCVDQHPPSQTITQLQISTQLSQQTSPEVKCSSRSASDTCQKEPLPQLTLSRHAHLPAMLSPVVRLIDIASVTRSCPVIKPCQSSPNQFTTSSEEQAASTSTPQVLTHPHNCDSGNKDSIINQPQSVDIPNTTYKMQTAPASTICQATTLRPFSRLSRKYRQMCNSRRSQSLDGFSQNLSHEESKKAPSTFQMTCPPFSVSMPLTHDGSTSAFQSVQSGNVSSVSNDQIPSSTRSSQQVVPQNTIKPHLQTHSNRSFQSKTLSCSTVVSSSSNSDRLVFRFDTSKVRRARMRSSLSRQYVELQSVILQPYVRISRLSSHECHRITNGRSSATCVEPAFKGGNDEEVRKEKEEDADSSFDPNTLYSSHSSSSDSEDSIDHDPNYKPCIKKKRLLMEYEAARSLNHR